MIKNIDLDAKTGEIKITAGSADDLLNINNLEGFGIDAYLLHVKTSPEYRKMEVVYHVPEGEAVLTRPYANTQIVLGEPRQGIQEYGVTIKPLAQSQDGRALPSPEQTTPELYYEDFRQLADNLLKENLIAQEQHEQMLNLGRTSLPAFLTVFAPNAENASLEVTANMGRTYIPYLDEENRQILKRHFTPIDQYSPEQWLNSRNRIKQLADGACEIGSISEEQKESFVEDTQKIVLKSFALDQLIAAQASANFGQIFGDVLGQKPTHKAYSDDTIAASSEYVNIMLTIMDTGDLTDLTPQQLQLMQQIGNTSDSIHYKIGDFLARETATISGRENPFLALCQVYHEEIKSALHAKESGLIDADGSVLDSQAVALPDLLPKNLVHLTYTLTTKIEGGKTLLNLWADAGNYDKITKVFSSLTKASDNSNNMLGRSDVWQICNQFFDEGYNPKNNLASVAENNEILQAIVAGLADNINSPLSKDLLPKLAKHIPATLPIILEAIKIHGDAKLLEKMATNVRYMSMGRSFTEQVSEDSPFNGWEEKFTQAAKEIRAAGKHSAAEAEKTRDTRIG